MNADDAATDALGERRAMKDRLLEAAFTHAAFDGWNRRTLLNAAADAGVDKATARRLFPQGGESLLAWLDDWADRRMLEAVEAARLSEMSVRRRIAWLIRRRLEILGPHREAMRRAAAARVLPTQAIGGGQALWRTVDAMWRAAGIAGGKDEGFSWYSRRATLAGVLLSTFFYWLDDQDEEHMATWAFLDRRIADVMRLGEASGRVKGILGRVPGLGGAFPQ